MARNYYLMFTGRCTLGGNRFSFIGATEEEVVAKVELFKLINPTATIDWNGKRGYFLVNKANVIGLLDNWVQYNFGAFQSSWLFFQDGLIAKESPRQTWSDGE